MAKPGELEITSAGAIEHLIAHRPKRIQTLFLSKQSPRLNQLESTARAQGIKVEFFSAPKTEGDVRATLLPFEYTPFESLLKEVEKKKRCTVLALDHLQDPQNLGAICRTADGLGVAGILIPKDRSVSVTAGAYHASVGAVETVSICRVVNLGTALRALKDKGFWIVGGSLSEKATPPWEIPDFEKVALVMGSEYEGLAEMMEKLCDWRAKIPLQGKAASLNVSVSTALLLYELFRRRSL